MRRVFLLVLAILLSSCVTDGSRGGHPTAQGWTDAQRRTWYGATQGSRLVPWDWARALVDSSTGLPFFGDANIVRFGYLPSTTLAGLALPVGFGIDDGDDSDLTFTRLRWYAGQGPRAQWLGMNCSACHTAVIAHGGTTKLIDGAPTMADFQTFVEAFDASLAATLAQPARFDAFAAKVLAGRDTSANRTLLQQELAKLVDHERAVAAANREGIRYGPARLDAFGHIMNKVALLAGGAGFTGNPADAPVSYPFIWNTHQADRLQWNGIAKNQDIGGFDVGALGRNVGEVIGVFGDVAIRPDAGAAGYASSVAVSSLAGLEIELSRLRSPVWPADLLGPIDSAKAAAGQVLYERNCAGCHAPLAPDDLKTKFTAQMSPFNVPGVPGPGTDMQTVCNVYQTSAPSGALQGTLIGYVKPGGGPHFAARAQLTDMLPTTVVGVLVGQKFTTVGDAVEIFFGGVPSPKVVAPSVVLALPPPNCHTDQAAILAYKARPLNGVWATAPFLHNGSVPTLADLLLPADQRPTRFYVGSREYDPAKVGFVTLPSAANAFLFDTTTAGNRNTGHDFTGDRATQRPFTAADRANLVEYMKTL